MITISADSRRATATSDEPITAGSVGIPVHVILSAEFDSLQAVVTFRAGAAAADVPLLGQKVTVPTQCLTQAGKRLMVGVYGSLEDGTIVIPTIWADAGMVCEGTRPSGIEPVDPTPSWAAQVQRWAREARDAVGGGTAGRVTSLDGTRIVAHGRCVEIVGVPVYVADVSGYAAYGITETGWYAFAKVEGPDGARVTPETTITGADGSIAIPGEDHVCVAVRFDVAAQSREVAIGWGETTDELVFRATDLAVRNLDYRTSYYVYDISPYATWEYGEAVGKYMRNVTYFDLVDGEYVPIESTSYDINADIPEGVYKHTKVVFEGMVRNVTYQMPDMIDCPIEFKLPDIPEDGYGAWYEVQMRYQGAYSMTLTPESSDVRAATDATQSQTGGVNIVDLHFADVAGAKIWRMVNTHSNFIDTPEIADFFFRTPPTKTAYAAGEALDMSGCELVATYDDGTRAIIDLDAIGLTLSPANGSTLAAGTTEVTATYDDFTATTPITVE